MTFIRKLFPFFYRLAVVFASHREPKTRANRSKATTKKPANAIKQPTRLGSLDIFRS